MRPKVPSNLKTRQCNVCARRIAGDYGGTSRDRRKRNGTYQPVETERLRDYVDVGRAKLEVAGRYYLKPGVPDANPAR